MFSHVFFFWALGLLFSLALFMAGAHIESRFQGAQVGLGLVLAVLCGWGITGTLKSPPPSWSTIRPVVQEAAAFRHDPPAIAAIWEHLQTGHRLTENQWVAFQYWVNHEKRYTKETREKRIVERIAADHMRAQAHKAPHA